MDKELYVVWTSLLLLWFFSICSVLIKPDLIPYNWLAPIFKAITVAIPVYVFLFRIKNSLLMKSIKSANDLLIKTNETCINVFLDEDPQKTFKDIKKVSLYLTYLKSEVNNFPYGGPISALLFSKKMNFLKEYEREALKAYSDYYELITLDTIIENKTSTMTKEESEELIDRIIHSSTILSNILEKHLRKYI
jgi:hypothetical protein